MAGLVSKTLAKEVTAEMTTEKSMKVNQIRGGKHSGQREQSGEGLEKEEVSQI